MLDALKTWKEKNKTLISMLGAEYLKGLNNFPTAFQKAINETKQ